MSPEIVLYVVIGTILGVLFGIFTLVSRDELKKEDELKDLAKLELAIFNEWESTMADGLENGETPYKPKDVFGRPFPLEHALACVGNGWAELIRECYQLCVETGTDISQVKEKFGGLRFYVGGSTIEALDKIEAICERSYSTCENCGKPGKLNDDRRWYKTLCSECDSINRVDQGHELYHLLPPDTVKESQGFLSPDLPTKEELE